jgi:glycosyltransferase involved in cell wall biosynthesis
MMMFVHTFDNRAVAHLASTLSGHLVALGVEVRLLCATKTAGAPEVPDGVILDELGLGGKPTGFGIRRAARVLRARRPHVVFAHGNGPNRTALLARALSRARTRVVTVEHTNYSTSYAGRHRLQHRATALLYARADRVTGVSPDVVEDLARTFPRLRAKTLCLRAPGPDPAEIERLASSLPDHPWFAAGRSHRIICSVANIIPRKGQETLVAALPLIREREGDVRLVLVGRFDDEAYLARLRAMADDLGVADHVAFAGYRSEPLPFIANADVFALASVREGMGIVLVEAMACGVPVVATDCPSGPSYVLEQGAAGRLVPMRAPRAMADAIVELLQDRDLREQLVSRGRQRAEYFSPRRVAHDYLALAMSLTGTAPREGAMRAGGES